MQIILNVSPVVIEVFMAALLSLAVFRRRVSYAAFAGMLCGALGASLLFLHFLSNIGFRIPFSVILYTAWFSLAFYTEFRKALVLSCALVAYCFFGDAILLSPLLFVYSRSISLLEMSSHYPALSLYAKILELIGILLITRFVQRNARGKDRWISCGAKISIGLFAVSILINAAFFYAYRSNAANWGMRPETMLLILCTGLFIDFVSVLLLCILQFTSSRDEEIALKNSLKEAQSSVLLWAKAYEKERQHSHEFQNHLSCIYGLAENNTPKEDIMNYVNKLLTVTLPSIRYINTNNPVANVVFSQKDIIAHEKNISLLLDLDDLSAFPMKGDETAVFFSDLLDNAIEACEELPPEQKKYIKVMIHRKSSGYYLCINNPTAKPVTIRNNQVIFKPRHDQGRGFGIRNVLTILRRYNSFPVFYYDPKEKTFSFMTDIYTEEDGFFINYLFSASDFSLLANLMDSLDDTTVLTGFPDANGGQFIFAPSIGITTTCQHVEAAWEFLSSYLTMQDKSVFVSILKSEYEAQLDSLKDNYSTDTIPAIQKIIENATTVTDHYTPIPDIAAEEAAAFFAGEKTAEEVAAIIQNRVSIYLSEQR